MILQVALPGDIELNSLRCPHNLPLERWRHNSVPFMVECQVEKLLIPIFIDFRLTRLVIDQ